MSGQRDVAPLTSLVGMPVLSLATGNKLGLVRELQIDPFSGMLAAITLDSGILPYESIHSFGRDAIMARSDLDLLPPEASAAANWRNAEKLLGARVVTESGEVLGRVSNLFLTLKPPPLVVLEVRKSWLDRLLGRGIYLSASTENALSDDSARLIIPDSAVDLASSDLQGMLSRTVAVRTFQSPEPAAADPNTFVDDDDETIVRDSDDDETVVRFRDDDETIVRRPRT